MNLGTFVNAVRKAKKTSPSHPFIQALDTILQRDVIQALIPEEADFTQLPPFSFTLDTGEKFTLQRPNLTLNMPILTLQALPKAERFELIKLLFAFDNIDENADADAGVCHKTLVDAFNPEFISLCRALHQADAMREENVNWLGNQLDTDLLSPNLFMQTQSLLGARPAAERYLQALRNLVRDGTLTQETESWIHPTDNTAFQAMYAQYFSLVQRAAEDPTSDLLPEHIAKIAEFGLLTSKVISALCSNIFNHPVLAYLPDTQFMIGIKVEDKYIFLAKMVADHLIAQYAGTSCTESDLLAYLEDSSKAHILRANLLTLVFKKIIFSNPFVPRMSEQGLCYIMTTLVQLNEQHLLTPARFHVLARLAGTLQHKNFQEITGLLKNYASSLIALKERNLLPEIKKESVPIETVSGPLNDHFIIRQFSLDNTRPKKDITFFGNTAFEQCLPDDFPPLLSAAYIVKLAKEKKLVLKEWLNYNITQDDKGNTVPLDEETREMLCRQTPEGTLIFFKEDIEQLTQYLEQNPSDLSHFFLGKIYSGEVFDGDCPDEILNPEKALEHFSQVSEDSEYHADSLKAMYCIVSKSEEDGKSVDTLTDNTLADAAYLAAQHKLTVPDSSLTFFQHAMTDTQRLRAMAEKKDESNGNDLKADYALRVFGLK